MEDFDRTIHQHTEDDDGGRVIRGKFGNRDAPIDLDAELLLNPTEQTARSFFAAFEFFNAALFGNALPNVLITMQRKKSAGGYFCFERFGQRNGPDVIDEIALNPQYFIGRTDKFIASVLVHEQAHLWQFHFGKPGRGRYHNREWAAKMHEIGLMPSHTGAPGGKQTGDHVSHYIIENGSFDTEWQRLAASGFAFDYQDRLAEPPDAPRKLKVKYTCPNPDCAISVWGRPNLLIQCIECRQVMR